MSDQSRKFSDDFCLEVGRRVLDAYNQWTENPIGKKVVIPVSIPNRPSNQPDWSMCIECDMPWFIEYYYENGERKSRHWSLKEYIAAEALERIAKDGSQFTKPIAKKALSPWLAFKKEMGE